MLQLWMQGARPDMPGLAVHRDPVRTQCRINDGQPRHGLIGCRMHAPRLQGKVWHRLRRWDLNAKAAKAESLPGVSSCQRDDVLCTVSSHEMSGHIATCKKTLQEFAVKLHFACRVKGSCNTDEDRKRGQLNGTLDLGHSPSQCQSWLQRLLKLLLPLF